jgi:hypothetical protein
MSKNKYSVETLSKIREIKNYKIIYLEECKCNSINDIGHFQATIILY